MSIGLRVLEASRALYGRATERSLLHAVLALDASARRRYPRQRSNRDRYARFLGDNIRLITAVWLGAPVDQCRIRTRHPDLARPGECCALEDVLYHVLRSQLLREKNLTPGLILAARGIDRLELAGDTGQVLRLSHRLVEGCLAAVVLAPENENERTPEPAPLYLRRERYWVNRLWGRRDYFCREVLEIDLRDPAARGVSPAVADLPPRAG